MLEELTNQELRRLRADLADVRQRYADVVAENAALIQIIGTLGTALEAHGDHTDACYAGEYSSCSCGLSAALALYWELPSDHPGAALLTELARLRGGDPARPWLNEV